MALEHDLLIQARMLATVDAGVPSRANLRRAVSAAYYALFHLLVAESVALLVPASPAGLRARVARSFAHNEMTRVCERFGKSQMSEDLRALLPTGAPPPLRTVAATFGLLQQARHSADYDTAYTLSRAVALSHIKDAEASFHLWNTLDATDERSVFLTALAFAPRWSK